MLIERLRKLNLLNQVAVLWASKRQFGFKPILSWHIERYNLGSLLLSDDAVQGPKKLAALVCDVAETGEITSEEARSSINEDPEYTLNFLPLFVPCTHYLFPALLNSPLATLTVHPALARPYANLLVLNMCLIPL